MTQPLNVAEQTLTFGIPEKTLKDIAKKLLVTTSAKLNRGCLQSMHISRKNNLVTAYSTDTYRLSRYQFDSVGEDFEALVHRDYLKLMKKTGSVLGYQVNYGDVDSYPKCDQLIPNFPDNFTLYDVKNLIKAIKAIKPLKKYNKVLVDFNEGIACVIDEVYGTAEVRIKLSYEHNMLPGEGAELVSFNKNYFLDALVSVGTGSITLGTNQSKPLGLKRFQGVSNYEHYLMPLLQRKY